MKGQNLTLNDQESINNLIVIDKFKSQFGFKQSMNIENI